ncbi:2-C-methyl-D-erythritol 2,4-cyclodiphosphate synthase [Thiohalophilus thiocyanatoxydans]|uniref:2-C-methyl-D-erythritol 2,4-cyclodiphosphate synthase n=1 Tax=Thiohalophilus thiocyanatoxydans TaxID=381308 RepID=A0A4R8IIM6_9GAMM|nr:2-C-methyl-D-erythritol 2,4-cyclodiphosphate synthase [Thiohalophilus thiocyanatoxydans]TDY00138.1 2-C-methyl-D-erythritol 2,4-cyclodiphosphate synthase [Thiohalophilus thiocyanatoxydans]
MRIGQGFDAHRFKPGGRLVLGGVEIPHDQGLEAHSDGDVLIHALCDAILGALALGDIGQHFPDSDDDFKGIDSRRLLRQVMTLIGERDYRIQNADLTLIAQQPKLAPYIQAMRELLATDLQTDIDNLSIKATTTEGMGFTGRGEGIAAMAVVLIDKRS